MYLIIRATSGVTNHWGMTVIGHCITKKLAVEFCATKRKEKGFTDTLIIAKTVQGYEVNTITFSEFKI